MEAETLIQMVTALNPAEQAAVRRFIEHLKERDTSESPASSLIQAADEFVAEHPELLRRLAQ